MWQASLFWVSIQKGIGDSVPSLGTLHSRREYRHIHRYIIIEYDKYHKGNSK